jgi:hypothetical protein
MTSRFIPAAAVVTLTLAQAAAPVWSEPASDTTATVRDDARTAGHAIAHGATTVGHEVAHESREAGHSIADHTRAARDTVRDDSKKTGHTIADGARSLARAVHEGFLRLKAGFTGKSGEPPPKS